MTLIHKKKKIDVNADAVPSVINNPINALLRLAEPDTERDTSRKKQHPVNAHCCKLFSLERPAINRYTIRLQDAPEDEMMAIQ